MWRDLMGIMWVIN
jgi:hypothetical protein